MAERPARVNGFPVLEPDWRCVDPDLNVWQDGRAHIIAFERPDAGFGHAFGLWDLNARGSGLQADVARHALRRAGTVARWVVGEPHVSAFRLAIPLMAGPRGDLRDDPSVGIAADTGREGWACHRHRGGVGLNFVMLAQAHRVDGVLGRTGRGIISRQLGVFLAALAVQFVANGAAELVATSRGVTGAG